MKTIKISLIAITILTLVPWSPCQAMWAPLTKGYAGLQSLWQQKQPAYLARLHAQKLTALKSTYTPQTITLPFGYPLSHDPCYAAENNALKQPENTPTTNSEQKTEPQPQEDLLFLPQPVQTIPLPEDPELTKLIRTALTALEEDTKNKDKEPKPSPDFVQTVMNFKNINPEGDFHEYDAIITKLRKEKCTVCQAMRDIYLAEKKERALQNLEKKAGINLDHIRAIDREQKIIDAKFADTFPTNIIYSNYDDVFDAKSLATIQETFASMTLCPGDITIEKGEPFYASHAKIRSFDETKVMTCPLSKHEQAKSHSRLMVLPNQLVCLFSKQNNTVYVAHYRKLIVLNSMLHFNPASLRATTRHEATHVNENHCFLGNALYFTMSKNQKLGEAYPAEFEKFKRAGEMAADEIPYACSSLEAIRDAISRMPKLEPSLKGYPEFDTQHPPTYESCAWAHRILRLREAEAWSQIPLGKLATKNNHGGLFDRLSCNMLFNTARKEHYARFMAPQTKQS